MPNLREQILACKDTTLEAVEVSEWGGVTVYVRSFSGAIRDRIDKYLSSRIDSTGKLLDPSGLRSLVVTLSVCDDTGTPIFAETDVDAVSQKSAEVLARLYSVASRLNGLGDEPEKKD